MIETSRKKYKEVFIILLGSLVVLAIMQPWNLYFLNDDFEHIPNNNLIVRKNFLRPVSNFFLVWDRWLFNKSATGYFLTTLALHTFCTICVYYLCRQVLKHYNTKLPPYVALLAAIIFLFYPFHAEPLFWIISRVSVIAALFTILSLYYYLKKNEHLKYLLLSWLAFVIALFTYESMWNVLFLYCLISFLAIKKLRTAIRKELIQAGIFVFTFIVYICIRFISLSTITGGYADIDNNMSRIPVLLGNLLKLVARNFTPPFLYTGFSIIFFGLSVIIYAVAMAVMWKKNKQAAWLMVTLGVGVISGVITATPLSIDTHGNESERYIYYSSFFFCFFLAIVITLLKKQWKFIITGCIIILEITGLIVYNAHYRYTSAVVKSSLEFIKKYPDCKNAYFINVPGEYKGALIFRVCLPNAIRWIAPECKYDSVKIISQTEDAGGIIPFKTGEKAWADVSREKNFNSQLNTYSLKDSLNRNIIVNKNDAIFWFTDQGLYKVNIP